MLEMNTPSLEEMLEAGVHFGHTTSRWHPKMEPFLYGKRGNIHIIDLVKTREYLEKAMNVVADLAGKHKSILFVGVKPLVQQIVQTEAERAHMPYCVHRWIGGTLTNWSVISGMLLRMKQYEDDKASGKLLKYTKREQLTFSEDYAKLLNDVGGLRSLSKTPDAIFAVDVKYDKTAVAEAIKLGIPVIGIADSNINCDKLTHLIPANDDAIKSITLITKAIADAACAGKASAAAVVAPVEKKAE